MTCACVAAFDQFAACVGSGMSLLNCASFLTSAGIPVQSLFCAAGCASTCGVTLPTDGGDAGGGDTGTGDSSADGPG